MQWQCGGKCGWIAMRQAHIAVGGGGKIARGQIRAAGPG